MVETVLKTLYMLFAVKKRSKSGSYESCHPSSMMSSTALSVYLNVSRLNLAFTIYELTHGYLKSNLNVYSSKPYI